MAGVKQFPGLLGKHKGQPFLVVGAGRTIAEMKVEIDAYIARVQPIVIGINASVEMFKPYYHLWTNNERLVAHGGKIHRDSVLLIGKHLKAENLAKWNITDYYFLNCDDRNRHEAMGYDRGRIRGYYRTSGNLAIMLAHLMGAGQIHMVGVDGFTYKFDGNTHFYDSDVGERKSREEWWARYDRPVKAGMDALKAYGIRFAVITPTIYEGHYDASPLSIR